MRRFDIVRRAALLSAGWLLVTTCAAPILPQRSKPGGAARWAEMLAIEKAVAWSQQAKLCCITGAGVGADGWLPDRGGSWVLFYWSPEKQQMLQVTIDSDGATRSKEVPPVPQRGRVLPPDWQDSPQVWAATRRHQVQDPVHTLDAEFAFDVSPERFKDQPVWRIRFFEQDNSFETHYVSADAKWLASE
jgi:hypothetical protein